VDRSAPGNVACPPRRRSTTTSAMAYPGATRPRVRPPMHATSPTAQTAGSSVRQASSTTTPPRSPVARPASRARASRGRTPVAKTTTSTSRWVPSAKSIRLTWPVCEALSRDVAVDVRTSMPRFVMRRRRASPPPSSTWSAMRRGANSTTVDGTPSACRAPAASRPSRPPPTTAPRTVRPSSRERSSTQPRRAATSSSVR